MKPCKYKIHIKVQKCVDVWKQTAGIKELRCSYKSLPSGNYPEDKI
jgi:hypothetical protein